MKSPITNKEMEVVKEMQIIGTIGCDPFEYVETSKGAIINKQQLKHTDNK